MAHERKKGGQRKDKKNKRMHEAVDMRHGLAASRPDRPTTDEKDIIDYKPGSGSDMNRHEPPPPQRL